MSVSIDASAFLSLCEMVKNLQVKMDKMKETMENEQKDRIEQYKNFLQNQIDENKQLKSDLGDEKQENNNLKSDLIQKNNAISNLKSDLQDKMHDIVNIKYELKEKMHDNQKRIDSLNRCINEKNQEISRLQSDLDDKNRENRYLQSRLKNFQNEEDDNNSYTVSVIDSEMKFNFFIWANIFGVKEDDAINFAKESFRTQNTILSRAQYIRDHMNEKYGRSWHCIIMFNPRRHAEAFCAKDCTKLYFKIGKYEVLLYQT